MLIPHLAQSQGGARDDRNFLLLDALASGRVAVPNAARLHLQCSAAWLHCLGTAVVRRDGAARQEKSADGKIRPADFLPPSRIITIS
jgi:hypothetical protein